MSDAAENALIVLEDSLVKVHQLVKASSYGIRVASKRIGDLTSLGGPLASAAKNSAVEMEELVASLEHAEENLSEIVLLALGDHFRRFLMAALSLPQLPGLPQTPGEIEELAGVPGAMKHAHFRLSLGLQLYRVALEGGELSARSLEQMGVKDLELVYTSGKVKMFRAGDRVALSEEQLEAVGHAYMEAARAIRTHLMAS